MKELHVQHDKEIFGFNILHLRRSIKFLIEMITCLFISIGLLINFAELKRFFIKDLTMSDKGLSHTEHAAGKQWNGLLENSNFSRLCASSLNFSLQSATIFQRIIFWFFGIELPCKVSVER